MPKKEPTFEELWAVTQTPEFQAEYRREVARLSEANQKTIDDILAAERITEKDLMITINARG